MSEAFDRGRAFEVKVQKITRQKLHLDVQRDRQSGAGIHKADVRDRYNELPIFIECKDHETIKPKAWWREADGKSSYGQAPVVVFPDNEEVLCVMRYTDLLNLVKEIADWKETADDLRVASPTVAHSVNIKQNADGTLSPIDPTKPSSVTSTPIDLSGAVAKKIITTDPKLCKNGHISDEYGYCQQLTCPFSRGYKKPKIKKGRK